MPKQPKKKDGLLIAAVLAVAAVLFAASRFAPRARPEDRVADATLAPDAVEYVEPTPAPADAPTAAPTATPEPTAAPTDAPKAAAEPTAEPEITPEPTAKPAEDAPAGPVGPMPAPQTDAVRGYVVLSVNGRQYGDPIPMDRDKIITLRQEDGMLNRVHITPEKVYMESSTCENQDCVEQGEVTLDNYQTRILSAFIICLPNGVTVELVPAEGE